MGRKAHASPNAAPAAAAAPPPSTTDLVSEGVDACGTVVIAALGQVEMAIDDLAEEREADLITVTSERPSWPWVFAGSGIAHHLLREGRWPVVVIPDRHPGFGAWVLARLAEPFSVYAQGGGNAG